METGNQEYFTNEIKWLREKGIEQKQKIEELEKSFRFEYEQHGLALERVNELEKELSRQYELVSQINMEKNTLKQFKEEALKVIVGMCDEDEKLTTSLRNAREFLSRILKYYEKDLNCTEIAKLVDCSKENVRQTLQRLGLYSPVAYGRNRETKE